MRSAAPWRPPTESPWVASKWSRTSRLNSPARSSGKKIRAPLQLHRRLRSGDRLGEPMRPLHREVDVIRAPDDEGWRPQLAQLRLDHSRVLVVESHDEALQVARTLFAPYQRPEINLDVFVRDGLGPLISRPKRAGLTKDCLVGEHRVQRVAQAAGFDHIYKRL